MEYEYNRSRTEGEPQTNHVTERRYIRQTTSKFNDLQVHIHVLNLCMSTVNRQSIDKLSVHTNILLEIVRVEVWVVLR